MQAKTIFHMIGFMVGVAINLIILAATVNYVYTYTIKGFEAGKKYMADATEEKPSKEVKVTIKENASSDEVGKVLEESGIIKNRYLFKLETLLKGNDDEPYPGGEFTLNTTMDTNQINYALRNTSDAVSTDLKITIREGFSIKDIAEYLESEEIVTGEEFLEAAKKEYDYYFLKDVPDREYKLEGYLFPDTYFIREGSTAEEIIKKMLYRFEDIYTQEYAERAAELGLTTDEVITIASIIEKEIKVDVERADAAQVIYNRLEIDMNLQMCSTVLFVLDKRKDRLTDEDLQVDSPYNTYENPGLPAGPISNPGEACIRAALYPSQGEYLYFVVKDEETGEHFFTGNYDSFVNAKVEYKQKY